MIEKCMHKIGDSEHHLFKTKISKTKSIPYFLKPIQLIFFIIACIGLNFNLIGQTTQGPAPKWITEEATQVKWDGTNKPDPSDPNYLYSDDWWYNHIKLYDNGVHVGYIASGYSTWADASVPLLTQNNCFQYPTSSTYYDCEAFESSTRKRGMLSQVVARYSLDGEMVWCRRFNQDSFFEAIQDDDGNIVLVGITSYVKDKNGNPIRYNPTPNFAGFELNCLTASNSYSRKLNLVKIDINGNEVFNYIYGMQNGGVIGSSQWEKELSEGWSLIQFGNTYRVVGRTQDNSAYTGTPINYGFMIEVNKSGELLNKQKYSGYTSADQIFYYNIKNGNGNLLLTGKAFDNSTGRWNAIVQYFPGGNFSSNPSNVRVINPSTDPQNLDAVSIFSQFLEQQDMFVVPVMYNRQGGSFSAKANIDLHFFDDNFSTTGMPLVKTLPDQYAAFDLKMNLTEVNNGFITVSSIQKVAPLSDNHVNNILNNLYPNGVNGDCPLWSDQPSRDFWMTYWNSNAIVEKYTFDANNNEFIKVWESTFDVDSDDRQFFPGDIKKQECLYSITTDDADGSVVISGNTSNNFDDYYLVKLYPDNCIGLSYDEKDLADNIIEINSNTVWASSRTVLGEVRIKTGKTLTISGANTVIKFADSKRSGVRTRIAIEEKGKLIVNDARLTSDDRCAEGLWEGIVLEGSNTIAPILNNFNTQPVVELNKATIDNATTAIRYGADGQYRNYKGIIRAEDATFRVTRRAVEFLTYKLPNISYFKRCTFEFIPSITEQPINLITAWDNHGVKFYGCSFLDNTGIDKYSPNNANGIYSIDATYEVMADCNSSIVPCPTANKRRSVFYNLNQGIYATGAGVGSRTIRVEETDFFDNSMGMRVEALNNVSFIKNWVLTGNSEKEGYLSQIGQYQFGFYSDRSSGYEIEQNTFEKSSTASFAVAGINIINSGSAPNEVYRNNFIRNDIGQKLDGENKDSRNNWVQYFRGLVTKCNDNSNVGQDIQVNKIRTGILGDADGISQRQGTAQTSASNLFSASNTVDIENFSAQSFRYYYNNNAAIQEPIGIVGAVAKVPVANSAQCATRHLRRRDGMHELELAPNMVANYYSKLTNYEDMLYIYSRQIDGGNTDSLMQAIQMTFSDDAQSLRNDLLAQAPYLSQEALMEAAFTGLLSDGVLLEICLANPEATYGDNFLNVLEFDIPNPLPANMIQIIYQNWDSETPRSLFEDQLADLDVDLGRMASQLIHYYALDTLDHTDSIESILVSQNSLYADYQRVELAIEQEDFTKATDVLNLIGSANEFDEEELAEHMNYLDYVTFRQLIADNEGGYMKLNSNQLKDLRDIAFATQGRSAKMAQNILCFGYDECDFEVPAEQFRTRARRMYDFENKAIVNTTSSRMDAVVHTVYPNPTKEQISIKITNFSEVESYEVQLREISGKLLLQQGIASPEQAISLSNLAKGSYLLVLYKDGLQVAEQVIAKN